MSLYNCYMLPISLLSVICQPRSLYSLWAVQCTVQESGQSDMQNVMSMPSAARVNLQGFGKLMALIIHCFVLKLVLVAFCALFSATLCVKLDFIGINMVR